MEPFSKESIENTEYPVFLNISPDSSTLLIAFGGVGKLFGVPIFEFFQSLTQYSIKQGFIRDCYQSWYQRGLKGISQDVTNTAIYLKEVIETADVKRVVFIGNSSGGYAAILFGILLGIDEVIAFSPQTFIDSINRKQHSDFRWDEQIQELYTHKTESTFFDLKPFIETQKNTHTLINIHYCQTHELDAIHALRLSQYPQINLLAYSDGGHGLIRLLKIQGKLDTIIKKSLY